MQEINITIDGKKIKAKPNMTILEVARENGIDIPTLCFMKEVNNGADCRLCIVEVEGQRGFVPSCIRAVSDGMVINTNTKQIKQIRKTLLDLIISNHCQDCLTCTRNGKCELQDLAKKMNIQINKYEGKKNTYEIDDLSCSIKRDMTKCVLCRRCVSVCSNVQDIYAIDVINRGFESKVAPAFDISLAKSNCVNCGQCIRVCPVGALSEKDNTREVFEKLEDEDTVVIFQTAPAVRAALGEEFGYEIGTDVTGKMVNAIKHLGADYVFDTNTGADFTIVEEATEFVNRFLENKNMPMFTSCCPAWVKFVETNYPEQIKNLSSCKSPHQMFGAILKKYYSQILDKDIKNIFVVSVMPCVAKKYESQRPEMSDDIDAVITTRELANMIKMENIDFTKLEDEKFDNPFYEATGAAAIFGTSGGVMEAALRYAQEIITREKSDNIEFECLRQNKQIKEASLNINGKEINIAVTSGLKNARKLIEEVANGKSKYDFIEVMACPGGCIMGGGQPIVPSKEFLSKDIRDLRANVLYNIDQKSEIRKSQDNPYVQNIYDEFLVEPESNLAKKILHTKYQKKKKYE